MNEKIIIALILALIIIAYILAFFLSAVAGAASTTYTVPKYNVTVSANPAPQAAQQYYIKLWFGIIYFAICMLLAVYGVLSRYK
jgi:hypothetical protein